jgi:hypothetical protein
MANTQGEYLSYFITALAQAPITQVVTSLGLLEFPCWARIYGREVRRRGAGSG